MNFNRGYVGVSASSITGLQLGNDRLTKSLDGRCPGGFVKVLLKTIRPRNNNRNFPSTIKRTNESLQVSQTSSSRIIILRVLYEYVPTYSLRYNRVRNPNFSFANFSRRHRESIAKYYSYEYSHIPVRSRAHT